MVRALQDGVDVDRLREGLIGPWRYDSTLPSLGWDARGERIHALRGFDPSKEKRSGIPGADWLALLGLRFLPVSVSRGQLRTTRSEERRVGKEWVRTCRSRGSPYH